MRETNNKKLSKLQQFYLENSANMDAMAYLYNEEMLKQYGFTTDDKKKIEAIFQQLWHEHNNFLDHIFDSVWVKPSKQGLRKNIIQKKKLCTVLFSIVQRVILPAILNFRCSCWEIRIALYENRLWEYRYIIGRSKTEMPGGKFFKNYMNITLTKGCLPKNIPMTEKAMICEPKNSVGRTHRIPA